jgi:WD40 repeat protein
MDRCPSPQQLQRLLAEAVSDAPAIEAHVEGCASCQQALETLTAAALPRALGAGQPARTASRAPADPAADFLCRLEALAPGRTQPLAPVTGRAVAPPGPEPAVIADYEILGVLGRGGMGVVYQAWHTTLKRVVALKMLLVGDHARPDEYSRFRIESEAAARLQHPNIVQVHAVGEQDGRPFLALEYVDGGTLAQRLAGTPVPPREAAQLVETLARAMDYAHRQGILHRDLKPANVLLERGAGRWARGEVGIHSPLAPRPSPLVPKITDFGLAKLVIGGADQTRSGSVLGTPSYMAPEQAGGKTRDIGPGVDIYALGAILYELLTSRPPFCGETVADTLQQVLSVEPVPPRRLQPTVPRDLDTICLKCLEKEPRRRYASAADLAEDLRRFQANEPVRARPGGPWRAVCKWARRKPAAAALVLVSVVAAIGLASGGLWYQVQLEQSLRDVGYARDQADVARGIADRKREEAEVQRDEARQNLYLANMPLAQRAWDAARVERVRALLDSVQPREAAQKDLRHFEWRYLDQLLHSDLCTLKGHAGAVTAVTVRADGQQLASAGADGTIRLWDVATGTQIGPSLTGHNGRVTAVVFNPRGTRLASAGADRMVCLWDVESTERLRTFAGHAGWVYSVAFSPDGRWLASASADTTIKVWDAHDGQQLQTLNGHTKQATTVAFDPAGRWLASGGADHKVHLWDVDNARIVQTLDRHRGWVYSVAFSPDGTRLASSGFDDKVLVWDTTSVQSSLRQAPLELLGHAGQVRGVAFSPDGTRVASAGFDQSVRVWDAAKGQPLFFLKGHAGHVNGVAFHPDGRRLASAGEDGLVKLWDATRDQEYRPAQSHATGPVAALAFSPDGTRLASGGADRLVLLWQVGGDQPAAPLQGHTAAVTALAFSPDGTRLATGGADRTVRLWDRPGPAAGPTARLLGHHGGRVSAVAFSPDGARLASAGYDGRIKLWDVKDGQEPVEFRAHAGRVLSLAFNADGTQLATGGDDKVVHVWEMPTRALLRTLKRHTDWVHGVTFSADGRWLASAGADGTIRLWDAPSGTLLRRLEGHAGQVSSIAFSHDGLRLASAGYHDKSVKVWDVARGQELLSLPHRDFVLAVVFSADGARLATAGADPGVRIYDAIPKSAH